MGRRGWKRTTEPAFPSAGQGDSRYIEQGDCIKFAKEK